MDAVHFAVIGRIPAWVTIRGAAQEAFHHAPYGRWKSPGRQFERPFLSAKSINKNLPYVIPVAGYHEMSLYDFLYSRSVPHMTYGVEVTEQAEREANEALDARQVDTREPPGVVEILAAAALHSGHLGGPVSSIPGTVVRMTLLGSP